MNVKPLIFHQSAKGDLRFTVGYETFGAKYPHEQIESRAGEFLVNLQHSRVGLMAKLWSQRIGKDTRIAV